MKFEGIYTPIITPHTEDGSINMEAFAEVAEFLIDAGVHCIVVGGSTGEYYAQTNKERIEMMNFAREIINKRVLLMVGTGATRTEDCVMLAKAAKAAGADFLLVNSPPYAVPTDEENAMHALQVDQAANLPIMLYNYPGRTGLIWVRSFWIVWDSPKISAASRKVPEILTAFTCSRTTIPTSGCAAAWTIRRLSSLPGEPDAGFAPVQTFCRKSTSHFMKPVCLKAITQKGVESCRRCFH